MKIVFVGTGYVGLVSGTCFAEMGTAVCCVDIDEAKIQALQAGKIPIYEPGLDDLVQRNMHSGRLRFASRLCEVLPEAEVVFCAPGTPPREDGSADLRAVWSIAEDIARYMDSYKLVVIKSTVPVGTVLKVKQLIQEVLTARGVDIPFDVASNPEFLKEGDAIRDFMHPDRIVVGVENARAQQYMEALYRPFTLNGHPIFFMDIASAEMTKYASNAMLATRISFMNEMARLCEAMGADIQEVRRGMGSDPRIGPSFLYAGTGYGGSCFPKDVKALIHTGLEQGVPMQILEAAESVNARQKQILFEKLHSHFQGDLKGKTIALWGLAFKPQTDDIREAPALVVIDLLLRAGAKVQVFDPVAMPGVRALLGEQIHYASDMYQAVADADALLLMTEWKEFRLPRWEEIRQAMCQPLVFDGRNIFDGVALKALGFTYFGIGRK
jgi:nucleotide sugar dehydrogenase